MSPQITATLAPVSYRDMHTISNGNVSEYALGVKAARALVERFEQADRRDIAALASVNAASVRAELDVIATRKAADPVYHAQCCVVFALISPNMAFDQNVELTRRVMANLHRLDTLFSVGRVMKITTKAGKLSLFNGWKSKARYIHANLAFIQNLTPAQMTRDNLLALPGMGPKASAMAIALWDEHAPVFTLDIWMFRLTREILGEDVAVKFSAQTPAYKILEAAWVAWANTLETSVFETQWTLWNAVGFGKHMSHLPIFGYDA
jgi:endonuclease III